MGIRIKSKYFIAISVSLITFAVYLEALRNGFVDWDDGIYVVNNPNIRSFDLAFLKWAFLDFYASNWHPLTWISHALDYALWGLNPLGHHLTSIALHAVNSLIVVFLIVRIMEASRKTAKSVPDPLRDDRAVLITGAVTGLLFGIHPVHVESVAWVAERKDLICALFFMLSIITYVRYACGEHRGRGTKIFFLSSPYLFSLGFFMLALMSKPMAVSLPAILIILEWYPLKKIVSLRTFMISFVEKLPFIALSLASAALTILAQKTVNAILPIEALPLSTRLLVATKSLVTYLWKMVIPLNLVPLYPYPKNVSLLSTEYLLPILMVVFVTALFAAVSGRQKLWLSVWSCYVVTLMPVIGIVQVGSQSMADRYTYLTSLGPFFLIGLAAAWTFNKVNATKRPGSVITYTYIAAALCVFVPLGYLTSRQIGIWKNSFSLWSYVVEKEPDSISVAYTNLGKVLFDMGRYQEAVTSLDKAITLNPEDALAYNNRGTVFEKLGQVDKAFEDYKKAASLNPNDYKVYYNLGIVFSKTGQVDKAIDYFDRSIALNPNNYLGHMSKGILYLNSGLFDTAIDSFNRSLAINPSVASAYNNRGLAYAFTGRYDKAVEDYKKAIVLDPNFGSAYFNRGELYARLGNIDPAISDFRMACTLGNTDGCNALRFYRP